MIVVACVIFLMSFYQCFSEHGVLYTDTFSIKPNVVRHKTTFSLQIPLYY